MSHWLSIFSELDESPELRQASSPGDVLLTDEEIEQLKREIEHER